VPYNIRKNYVRIVSSGVIMNKTTKELPLRYVERELQLISIDPLVMFDQKGIILDVS